MENLKIIKNTVEFVKNTLKNAEKGHDWWHIQRVRNMAMYLAEKEGGNKTIIELAALLHDISDAKFNGGNIAQGAEIASAFLETQALEKDLISQIQQIIRHISFKGGLKGNSPNSIEFYIVQDADSLDAIGAIGIARTFQYGGFKNREIYNPDILPNTYKTADEYYKSSAPTINHFYEKLLLLKDMMHTQTARDLAEQRHQLMENFLSGFFAEWNFNAEQNSSV